MVREVTDPTVLEFFEDMMSRIDLKEELFALGLQIYADEFFEHTRTRLVVIKEIEYTPMNRQLAQTTTVDR